MSAPRRLPSSWPREHGAYVQLLAPLLAALASTPSRAGLAISAGAMLAFVANESLLVAIGGRGRRLRAEAGGCARRRLAVLGGAALLSGATGLALAPHAAVLVALLVAVPAALTLGLAARRTVHTLGGELAAAAALAGAAAPVLVAGGEPPALAIAVWLAWAAGFATTILAVQDVLRRHQRQRLHPAPSRAVPVAACAVIGVVVAAVAVHVDLRLLVGSALAAASIAVVLSRPATTRLRAVGITLAVVSTLAAVGAVLAPCAATAA